MAPMTCSRANNEGVVTDLTVMYYKLVVAALTKKKKQALPDNNQCVNTSVIKALGENLLSY